MRPHSIIPLVHHSGSVGFRFPGFCLFISLLSFSLHAQDSSRASRYLPRVEALRLGRFVAPDSEAVLSPASLSTEFPRQFIRSYPSRSLNALLSRTPGILELDGDLHGRGSRAGQLGYTLDGFSMLDRYTSGSWFPYIPEAFESVTVHTGTASPLLGLGGGGVVEMRMRKGGDKLEASVLYDTDDYSPAGRSVLGTYSYGWKTAVATVGGPVLPGLSFFVAGQMRRTRDRTPMYLEPMNTPLAQGDWGSYPAGTPLPPLVVQRNHVPSHGSEEWALQGNMTASVLGFDVMLLGALSRSEQPSMEWPSIVENYFRQDRIPLVEKRTSMAGLSLSAAPSASSRITAQIAMTSVRSRTYDPLFGDEWLMYPDSLANAQKGYPGYLNRYRSPASYSVIYGFSMAHPNQGNNSYEAHRQSQVQMSLRYDHQLSDDWKIEAGLDAEWWAISRYLVPGISNILLNTDYDLDGSPDTQWMTPAEERIHFLRNSFGYDPVHPGNYRSIVNYGYTYRGEEIDEGLDAPKRPFLGGIALDAEWKEGGISISFGGRLQWVGLDNQRIPAGSFTPFYQYADPPFDFDLNMIDERILTATPVIPYALPYGRVRYDGGSFSLFGGYRSSIDVFPLRDLYIGVYELSQRVNPLRRVPYILADRATVLTYHVRPEKTSVVEFGGRWRPTDRLSIDVVVYRKDITDQLELSHLPEVNVVGLRNLGQTTVTGLEATLSAGPVSGFRTEISYAWTAPRGRSPDPWGMLREFTDWSTVKVPTLMLPLSTSREHRLLSSLTYDAPDGSILEGIRLALFGRLEVGLPYTKEAPPRNLGCCSPWYIGVRSIRDVRSSSITEPHQTSRTPFLSFWDLHVSYRLDIGPTYIEPYVSVTNLFDRKNTVHVYPTTGAPDWDGWLNSDFSGWLKAVPGYEEFYRTLNLQNRWAYMMVTGNDMYGAPRQVRVGLEVGI